MLSRAKEWVFGFPGFLGLESGLDSSDRDIFNDRSRKDPRKSRFRV